MAWFLGYLAKALFIVVHDVCASKYLNLISLCHIRNKKAESLSYISHITSGRNGKAFQLNELYRVCYQRQKQTTQKMQLKHLSRSLWYFVYITVSSSTETTQHIIFIRLAFILFMLTMKLISIFKLKMSLTYNISSSETSVLLTVDEPSGYRIKISFL